MSDGPTPYTEALASIATAMLPAITAKEPPTMLTPFERFHARDAAMREARNSLPATATLDEVLAAAARIAAFYEGDAATPPATASAAA